MAKCRCAVVIIDVDIGNSFAKWRVVGCSDVARQPTASLIEGWRYESSPPLRVRLASVASKEVTAQFCQQVQERWSVEVEVARVVMGVAGVMPCYTDLTRLGVDRWLAMLAAFQCAGMACVVVSAGSALTADWIDSSGLHRGGLIAPGRQSLLNALHLNVANVLENAVQPPASVALALGSNTLDCVLMGVNTLLAGFMDKIAEKESTWTIFLAGGDALAMLSLCAQEHKSRVQLLPNLVLDGLAIALP